MNTLLCFTYKRSDDDEEQRAAMPITAVGMDSNHSGLVMFELGTDEGSAASWERVSNLQEMSVLDAAAWVEAKA